MSVTHDWREWIGRTSTATAQLHAEQANCLAVTLDREPGLQPGDELPPGWHWLYFHDLAKASDLGPDGYPRRGLVLPPVPLPRRLWAGGSLELHIPLRLGQTVERTSVVRAITPKNGRSGALYFVDVEHTLRSAQNVHLVEQQTLVYRKLAPTVAPNRAPAAPTEADFAREWSLDGVGRDALIEPQRCSGRNRGSFEPSQIAPPVAVLGGVARGGCRQRRRGSARRFRNPEESGRPSEPGPGCPWQSSLGPHGIHITP